MDLNISKTRTIIFSRITNTLLLKYKLGDSYITRTNCIKDVGVFIESRLYSHSYVDYVFSQAIKLLCRTRNITFSFSTLDSLLTLHFSLVRPNLGWTGIA
jgi:hypothetical protein